MGSKFNALNAHCIYIVMHLTENYNKIQNCRPIINGIAKDVFFELGNVLSMNIGLGFGLEPQHLSLRLESFTVSLGLDSDSIK